MFFNNILIIGLWKTHKRDLVLVQKPGTIMLTWLLFYGNIFSNRLNNEIINFQKKTFSVLRYIHIKKFVFEKESVFN